MQVKKYIVRLDYFYGVKRNKKEKDIILVDVPHPKSPAHLILLKRQYIKTDETRRVKSEKREWRVWLTFRNRFLKRWKKKNGSLTCFYCKEKNLFANVNSPFAHGKEATLDHYIPQAKGGKKYDESNLRICCGNCNQRKKDLMPEDFKI
jgi:5-methylcytosine-specific restriction endonuclease McrA